MRRPASRALHSIESRVPGLRYGLCLLAGLALLLGPLTRLPAGAQSEPLTQDSEATVATKIVPGCLLSITVMDEPKLSGAFTVDAEGKVTFTLGDEDDNSKQTWTVTLKDKTVDEARNLLADSMKKYLVNPQVTLFIAHLPKLKVEIRGAARKTGTLELSLKATLSDAITACDPKASADLSQILLTRKVKVEPKDVKTGDPSPPKPMTKTRAFVIDFTKYQSGENEDDPKLEAGDVILLPTKPEQKAPPEQSMVRVEGEVKQEAGVPFGPGLTVKDCLERAGGLKETADRRKIFLIRRANGNKLTLDADKVLADDPVYNLKMEPGDLLLISVRDRSMQFAVMGEVIQESRFDWNPEEKVKLTDAIERAGGLKKTADRKHGVIRKGYYLNSTTSQPIPFDYDKVLKGKEPNYEIEAGDAIIFPPRQKRPSFLQQFLPMLFRFLPLGI